MRTLLVAALLNGWVLIHPDSHGHKVWCHYQDGKYTGSYYSNADHEIDDIACQQTTQDKT